MGFTDPNFYGNLAGPEPTSPGLPDFPDFGVPGDPVADPSSIFADPGFVPGGNVDLGGDSLIQKLLSSIKGNPQGFADAGTLMGGFENGEKANRILKGNFTQGYDNLMMQAERNRNENESDALDKLNVTNYLQNGGSHFKMPSYQMNGKSVTPPSFGLAPNPASDAQKQGAATLQDQLLKRLAPGGSYTPQPLESYAKPGAAENVGKWGGVISGGLGSLGALSQNPSSGGGGGQIISTALKNAPAIIKGISSFFGGGDNG